MNKKCTVPSAYENAHLDRGALTISGRKKKTTNPHHNRVGNVGLGGVRDWRAIGGQPVQRLRNRSTTTSHVNQYLRRRRG